MPSEETIEDISLLKWMLYLVDGDVTSDVCITTTKKYDFAKLEELGWVKFLDLAYVGMLNGGLVYTYRFTAEGVKALLRHYARAEVV